MSVDRRRDKTGTDAVTGLVTGVLGTVASTVIHPVQTAGAAKTAVQTAETKVKASTTASAGASAVAAVVLGVLNQVEFIANLDAAAKTGLGALILAVVVSLFTFVAGWRARHTHRPDLRVNVDVEVDGA